jgi:hypothetical protein
MTLDYSPARQYWRPGRVSEIPDADLTGTLVPADARSQFVLEMHADTILFTWAAKQTKASEKGDILTPWRIRRTYAREVYVDTTEERGVTHDSGLDRAYRCGMLHRSFNTKQVWLNSRDRLYSTAPQPRGPWHNSVESGGTWRTTDEIEHPVTIVRPARTIDPTSGRGEEGE